MIDGISQRHQSIVARWPEKRGQKIFSIRSQYQKRQGSFFHTQPLKSERGVIFLCSSIPRFLRMRHFILWNLETLKPSYSAFDARPESPVGCSLAVFVQTHSDPENSSDVPSICPVFIWKYWVMEQTSRQLVIINWDMPTDSLSGDDSDHDHDSLQLVTCAIFNANLTLE